MPRPFTSETARDAVAERWRIAHTEKAIRELVEQAPRLTAEQRSRLSAILATLTPQDDGEVAG